MFAYPSARAAAAAVASDKVHRPAAVHCHCIRLQSPPTPLTAAASAAFIIVLILLIAFVDASVAASFTAAEAVRRTKATTTIPFFNDGAE